MGTAFPALALRVVATDAEPELIVRARDALREGVQFVEQDVCQAMPNGRFDLILCRNVVLTYFEVALQREILQRMTARLVPSGALVRGRTEAIPAGVCGLAPWAARLGIYRCECSRPYIQERGPMDTSLPLSSEERETLRESLEAYLVELRRELAATEKFVLQKALGRRQEILERLLGRLAG